MHSAIHFMTLTDEAAAHAITNILQVFDSYITHPLSLLVDSIYTVLHDLTSTLHYLNDLTFYVMFIYVQFAILYIIC